MRGTARVLVGPPGSAAELWRTNRAWQSTLMVVRRQEVAVVEGEPRECVGNGEFSDGIDAPQTASAWSAWSW